MNWKIVFVGGLVYYVTMFVVSMGTGYFIHSPEAGVLAEAYKATAAFWRPELSADPPDMAALMPMWITTGLIGAFLAAGVYSVIRSALTGAAWQRGLKFGVITVIFALINMMGYWGVFNLPNQIWQWWFIDGVIMQLAGGIVLGLVAQKLAPAGS
ncbi:MAG TPA: hypothetical protein VFR29_09330 [Steroidobacteraceae bacterium]|nr:hypothetical protein [Steroidobacteraceae bacterium]